MTLDDFSRSCTQTAQALRDTDNLFRECAQVVGQDMAKGVREGVSPDGAAFQPLAHPRPGGTGGGPLMDSGGLATSMMTGPDHVETVTKQGFIVGSRKLGARLMQDGGWVLPKKGKFLAIPATPEAKAVGSPLNFPRPLVPRIGVKGGVLIEPGIMGAVGLVQYYLTRSVYVPARRPVGVSQRALEAVTVKVQDHVTKSFRRT